MAVACAQNLVRQIALIGEQEQTLGFFVEASYRVNADRIIQIFCHRGFAALFFGTADDSAGLVKKKQHPAALLLHGNAPHQNLLIFGNLIARRKDFSVGSYTTLQQKAVGFPPRAKPCFT